MGAHAGALPLSLQAPGGQHEVLQVAPCSTCGKWQLTMENAT